MKKEPVISVVIPAFDEEILLPRALLALKNQDFTRPYEVIVVDNRSTDKTAKVAKSFGAEVVFEPKRGVTYAREAGVKAARGTIIACTDADSIVPPSWLTNLWQKFREDKRTVAVTGPIDYLTGPWLVTFANNLWWKFQKLYFDLSKTLFYISSANFSYLKSAFNQCGGYNHSLVFGINDQVDILFRLKKLGRVGYLPNTAVKTSGRRFQRGFFYSIFIGWGWYFLVPFIRSRFFKRPVKKIAPHFREEYMPNLKRVMFDWAIASVIFLTIFIYACFSPTSQIFGKVYPGLKTYKKEIALTFDDGPNEPYTSEILNILKTFGVKATFFEIGKNIEVYPGVSSRLVKEGHVLGNHSYSHSLSKVAIHPSYQVEIQKTQEIIEKTTGVTPALFRPPHFFREPLMAKSVRRDGLYVITGTYGVAEESSQPPAPQMAKEIMRKVKPGGIIILHDGFDTHHGANRSQTVEALRVIIPQLQEEGYHFVTIPELLNISPYR